MIRIVIADDHSVIREGVKQILSSAVDLALVGEAQNGHEVMEYVRTGDFDVMLLDLSMPGRSGIELIKQVHGEKPKLRILVFSMHQERQYAVRAIKSGAAGYLTKDSGSAQLLAAIRKVASGGAFISSDVAEQLALGAMPNADLPPHHALSDREFQVLHQLLSGDTVSDIARQLSLSVKTVSTHKARLMQKMNMHNQTDLIHYAINHHLLDTPEPPA